MRRVTSWDREGRVAAEDVELAQTISTTEAHIEGNTLEIGVGLPSMSRKGRTSFGKGTLPLLEGDVAQHLQPPHSPSTRVAQTLGRTADTPRAAARRVATAGVVV